MEKHEMGCGKVNHTKKKTGAQHTQNVRIGVAIQCTLLYVQYTFTIDLNTE